MKVTMMYQVPGPGIEHTIVAAPGPVVALDLCDPDHPDRGVWMTLLEDNSLGVTMSERRFYLAVTGALVPDDAVHYGSVPIFPPARFHLFELPAPVRVWDEAVEDWPVVCTCRDGAPADLYCEVHHA